MTLAEQLYEKGVDGGKREMLARQVRLRFGRLPRWASQRLRDATGRELDLLADRLFSASVDEMFERE
ncbi:MAG: hypothetical protein MUF54_06185 [Polyangiaceae bacterium]|nr:hypothetical protein [Polyangiaceae bacterium]